MTLYRLKQWLLFVCILQFWNVSLLLGYKDLIVLFSLLYFTDTAGFFILEIEGLWQLYVKQVYWCYFSNTIFSVYVSVSHFGSPCNISKFALLLNLLRWSVLSDLWCYYYMYLGSLHPQITKGTHTKTKPYVAPGEASLFPHHHPISCL